MDLRANDHGLRVRPPPRVSSTPPSINLRVISNAINALSFSYDGEFIAIANAGNYIDIVGVYRAGLERDADVSLRSAQWRQACLCIVYLRSVLRRPSAGILQNTSLPIAVKPRSEKVDRHPPPGSACSGLACRLLYHFLSVLYAKHSRRKHTLLHRCNHATVLCCVPSSRKNYPTLRSVELMITEMELQTVQSKRDDSVLALHSRKHKRASPSDD